MTDDNAQLENKTVQGVAVALGLDPDGPLRGILLFGAPGTGKSHLAVELVHGCPFQRSALIADDVVLLQAQGGVVWASAPPSISGFIEVRGFGPIRIRSAKKCRIDIGFDLDAVRHRLPAASSCDIDGISVPTWPCPAGEHPALAMRQILHSFIAGQTQKFSSQ